MSTARRPPRVATRRESVFGAAATVIAAVIAVLVLPAADVNLLGVGLVFGMIMLSLVLLVGYAGQVSLAQMTFVGIGAFAMGRFFGGDSIWGMVLAAVLSGVVGAVAALPALRLSGLYLALSTLAFAQGMSTMFFKHEDVFGFGGRLPVGRPSVLGVSFEGDRAYFLLIAVTFAVSGMGLTALRRSRFGRKLVAMKDSPAACATLGLDLTFTKLAVFALSSAMAGLAGTFYGGIRGQVGSADFEMLSSLVLLLLVSVSGINTVSGAFFGGLVFAVFPRLQSTFPSLRNLAYLGSGLGALGAARNPNGWTDDLSGVGALVRRVLRLEGGPGGRDGRGAAPFPTRPTSTTPAVTDSSEEVRELAGTAG